MEQLPRERKEQKYRIISCSKDFSGFLSSVQNRRVAVLAEVLKRNCCYFLTIIFLYFFFASSAPLR